MKKILFIALLLVSLVSFARTAPAEVNEKVLKAFRETFSGASEVVWHEYAEYFQANFKQGEIQLRAQYDANGGLMRTMRYYGESQLLPNVVAKIRKKFGNREIFGVTEVSTESDVRFVISLRDAKNWFIVNADTSGNIELTDKYTRADN